MIWAQWGLKDRLINDADVWLCHQCADCTAKCPRDAKPGEVLGAIRRTAYRAHATPAVMGTLFSDIKYLPVVSRSVSSLRDDRAQQPAGSAPHLPALGRRGLHARGRISSRMMPITTGTTTFLTVAFLAALGVREPQGLLGQARGPGPGLVPRKAVPSLMFLGELASHASFKKCTVNAGRTLAPAGLLRPIGAFIATVLVYEWGTVRHLPRARDAAGVRAPACCRIFGNVGGLAIVFARC
jgi:hypothetical protein